MNLDTGAIATSIAGTGLAGVDLRFPEKPLGEAEWHRLLEVVNEERIWGLLSVAVSTGRLPATRSQVERAAARHRRAMESVLELEATTVEIFSAFSDAHLDVRLLKGSAVAHLDEVDPSWRCFNDIDLLVRGEDLAPAAQILRGWGYRRDLPERRADFDRRFGKEITMAGPNGREVDVHRTLAIGAFGLAINQGDLWSRTDLVRLAGRDVPALDAPRRLLHAAYAAVLGDPRPRLVLLRDLGLLLTGPVDADEVREVAQRWGGTVVLATAVRMAVRRFGAEGWALERWAHEYRASARERWLLASYTSQGGSNTRSLLSGLAAPGRAADRRAYLQGLLFPDRRYRAARRRAGRPAELRTGLRELASRTHRGRSRAS
jgi:hypothetical protein